MKATLTRKRRHVDDADLVGLPRSERDRRVVVDGCPGLDGIGGREIVAVFDHVDDRRIYRNVSVRCCNRAIRPAGEGELWGSP